MTAPIKIPENALYEIMRSWEGMRPKERFRAVEEVAADHEVTVGTIYRRIKEYREYGRRGQKKRSDQGKPRILSDEQMKECIKTIMGFKAVDPSKPDLKISNPNKAMSTARAIEILEKMGRIPGKIISARTANRWAKIYGTTVKKICEAKPAVKLVSQYPNQVHVIDFSVCEQFYLREKDGKIITRPWTYKNKPNESKQKIWTFALIDHYSTAKFIKYFLSPGESSPILFKGLVEAWSKKEDSQFPFHGAPKILYADKGSALRSEKIQGLLEALGIEVIYHKPGNPRAKGMVESVFKHFQMDFESELRHSPASTIEELNERAYNWLVGHNWEKQDGTVKARFARWQEISREQLLELPPKHILARVTASHQIRTVDAYCTIRINGETFGVPEDIVGKKVRVWYNIEGGISAQDIETGEMYPNVEPKTAVFGTYNAHKKSAAERNQDDAIRIGREISKEITPEVLRRDVPKQHAFPKTGTQMEIDSELIQEKTEYYTTIYQAKRAIAEESRINLGDLPGWMIDDINTALAKTLDKDKVHKIARLVESCMREERNAG